MDSSEQEPSQAPRAAHVPVMATEVLSFLGGCPRVLDMTLGAGGHAELLLQAGVEELIGIDRDPSAAALATERLTPFGSRFALHVAPFSQPPAVAPVDGVLYDLGVSSMQLDEPARGFSFRADAPLDMRMGVGGPTARDLVNDLAEEELADLIYELGEERKSRLIAKSIVRARQRAPLETTDQLTSVIVSATGSHKGGAHPARRTFQALRIAVNRELEELSASLPQAVSLLAPGGRIVVISYHSLEDRIVKYFFREQREAGSLAILTKKPLVPSDEEIEINPRARAAKLRAAERPAERPAEMVHEVLSA